MRRTATAFAVMLALVAPLAADEPFNQTDKPESLKALMVRLRTLIHEKKDFDGAEQIFTGLLPDKLRLKQALAENVADEQFDKCWALHLQLAAAKPDLSKFCKPEQTEVQVHGATTEEIAAYAKDSLAFKQFPQGAKRVADEKLLRPGMTYYEVAFVAPGQERGMKYHLFFWDGKKWTMAGPLWRAVRE